MIDGCVLTLNFTAASGAAEKIAYMVCVKCLSFINQRLRRCDALLKERAVPVSETWREEYLYRRSTARELLADLRSD